MSSPNEDSFHASNHNHNVNPTYIYVLHSIKLKKYEHFFPKEELSRVPCFLWDFPSP